MNPALLFFLLTAAAFVLFVLEIYVPGGILAMIGGLCLLTACWFAVSAFGFQTGLFVTLLMILVTLSGFMFWLMKMPDSRIGRRFSLQTAITEQEPEEPSHVKQGDVGEAVTDLRPGGFARLNGRKTDVVAVSGYLEKGTRIEVTEVHGSRVVVRPAAKESA